MAGASLLLGGSILLSGCVGGPGSYFETVSRESSQQQVAETSPAQLSALALEPVESNELNDLPLPADGSNAPQEGTLAGEGATAASGNVEQFEVQPVDPNESSPILLGLQQDNNGGLILTPEVNPAPSANSSIPADNSAAYADAQTITPQEGAVMASLLPPGNLNSTGTDESGFAIGTESSSPIDPLEYAAEQRIPVLHAQIEHGKCPSGFGPRPKKISATKITPGDPYYIEIRMRKTPLLPVGHTYVAYGRLGADGEILDEHLIMLAPFGGYAGAALASGIPMPGVLTPHRDDCRIRPQTAYRVSLDAQRYEKLLKEVQAAKAEKPSYLLFAYNCNHFMTRIAQSVGLKAPKNIYVPALEYIYAMIENNEGRKISRR